MFIQYQHMTVHFLCCKLEAQPTEHTLTSLIAQHPHLNIFINSNYAFFSSGSPAVLTIIAEQFKQGVYPQFGKDLYEMLAQNEDQISKVSTNAVRICCKDDISLYFQEKVLKSKASQKAEQSSELKGDESASFSVKNEKEDVSNEKLNNLSYSKIQLTQIQTKKQWEESQECEQVQKINLYFSEGVQQERCFTSSSQIENQTKIQAIRSNAQQLLKSNLIKNQLQAKAINEEQEKQFNLLEKQKSQVILKPTEKGQSVLLKQGENGQQIFQSSQKEQIFAQPQVCKLDYKPEEQEKPLLSQVKKEKNEANQAIQIATTEKNELSNARRSDGKQTAVLLKKDSKFTKNKKIFTLAFLTIWIILLLKFYV